MILLKIRIIQGPCCIVHTDTAWVLKTYSFLAWLLVKRCVLRHGISSKYLLLIQVPCSSSLQKASAAGFQPCKLTTINTFSVPISLLETPACISERHKRPVNWPWQYFNQFLQTLVSIFLFYLWQFLICEHSTCFFPLKLCHPIKCVTFRFASSVLSYISLLYLNLYVSCPWGPGSYSKKTQISPPICLGFHR